ncbi:MAG TPA: hypothetical protein ENJ61_09210 [Aquifex aeolicus]|uniref:Uncharacterized protein n=1 Tax=Aquifex aeolicus TaxID=63363 RepID=A0A7C5L3V1_AQUAO|nr:hypothetical protein [Aquifex aeolicus]
MNASQRTIRETERRVKKPLEVFGNKSLDYEFLIESYKQERLKGGVKSSTVNRESEGYKKSDLNLQHLLSRTGIY